jgi:hypothetical protein
MCELDYALWALVIAAISLIVAAVKCAVSCKGHG